MLFIADQIVEEGWEHGSMIDNDKCQHHIRNALGGYAKERRKILHHMLNLEEGRRRNDEIAQTLAVRGVINSIKRMDGHINRIELQVKDCRQSRIETLETVPDLET